MKLKMLTRGKIFDKSFLKVIRDTYPNMWSGIKRGTR